MTILVPKEPFKDINITMDSYKLEVAGQQLQDEGSNRPENSSLSLILEIEE